MLRAWREWRGRVKLFAPACRPCGYLSATLTPNFLGRSAEGDQPALAPYDGLAEVWDEYAARANADYLSFVAALTRGRKQPVRAALDLDCGDRSADRPALRSMR